MKKILIIQPAFIGDVILSTALIEKLKQYFPDAEIDFLLRQGNESILENNPHLNRIFIWNKKQNKYRNLFHIVREIRNTKYDTIINLQRFASSGFVTWRAKANEKVGYSQNPFSFCYNRKLKFSVAGGQHETQRNQQLIAHLTDNIPHKPVLYPLDSDFKVIQDIQKPFVTIAPASVWFTKQFPEDRWIDFLKNYLPEKYTVYLLGSSQDRHLCEAIRQQVTKRNIINKAGELSFLQSAALMQQAAMNYVNDSAPLHIASATDAPVTAVFCSTVPSFGFGPLSSSSKIVETPEKLHCRPCGLHGKTACPEKHFNCAYTILLTKLLF